MDSIIVVSDLGKTFDVGEQKVEVLKNVNFEIRDKDFAIITGPSGSGKSTILYSLLGLEGPTTGSVSYFGEDIFKGATEDSLSDFRKKHIGMVYQQANWVKSLTVAENVAFPYVLLGNNKSDSIQRAVEHLKLVGMEDWADYIPTELSAGQQQRVSLARAMINNPQIIIADEPTGNLDYENGQIVMNLFKRLNEEQGKAVIMVTHDLEYLTFAKTAIKIFDGQVTDVIHEDGIREMLKETKLKRGVLQ